MPNQLVRLHLAARVCTCLWHTCCVIVRVFDFVPPPQDLEHLPHDPHFECLQLTGQGFVLHTAFILSAPHLSPPNCGCLVTLRPCQHVWRHASRHVCRHVWRHVCRHVWRHVCQPAYRHACQHVCRHVFWHDVIVQDPVYVLAGNLRPSPVSHIDPSPYLYSQNRPVYLVVSASAPQLPTTRETGI